MKKNLILFSLLAISPLLSSDEIVLQDISIERDGMPVPIEADLKELLQPYMGKNISEETLTGTKGTILAFFSKKKDPYVLVEIPEQEIAEGKVRFNIVTGKIGTIFYTGNKWFSTRLLGRYLHAKSGETVNEESLLNDVASMNRNPFHTTQLILRPGVKKGSTDIELATQDRFPLRLFGGADNTGNPFTGNTRYFGGFNWGNAFYNDDILTYQYTTAEDNKKFWSHFANYSSFFSWGHTLFLYGGYSQIHPHIRDFHTLGKSYQGSLRYQVPLKPYYKYLSQEISFGGDVKGMNSSLFFSDVTGSIPVSTHLANLTQLTLNYGLQYKKTRNYASMNLEMYGMPAKWMANQTAKRFGELRPHALPRYFYARLYLADNWTMFWDFVLATNLRLQGATCPLMPSEQFSLGGYNTVRGYNEQSFNADAALCANLELRFPSFKLLPKIKNKLTLLAFADYGVGHNFHNDIHPVSSTEHLFSAGPGLRYEMYPYLSIRADYGFKFYSFEGSGPDRGKFHFSATASY